MSREWKPGDVAVVSTGRREYLAIRTSYRNGEYLEQGGWQSGPGGAILAPNLTARPLVVIDPEDREQVERLRGDLIDSGWVPDSDADDLMDVLREFADPKPPKPEEPTGLGAVVEDVEGKRWIRCNERRAAWATDHRDTALVLVSWGLIDVVRVLSEGIS